MADCSCIGGVYNAYVEALDKKTIIYQDLSNWMVEDNYEVATEYVVNITPPTSFKAIPVVMQIGQLNRLTANEIGIIKDGIYCFEVNNCGEKYKKSVAIFPYLQCCVKQAWATLDRSWQEKIEEIENHIKLSSINAELNNVKLASQELKIANKLLENIKCDCDC